MELLAKDPVMKPAPGVSGEVKQMLVYHNPCTEELPNFDCPQSALLSMFMMFTGSSVVESAAHKKFSNP